MERVAPLALLFLLACGGGAAKPVAPAAATASAPVAAGDAGAETFGEVNAADVAELQGGAKPAASSAAAAPAPAPAASEPIDECSPVGRDFEKRARPRIKECYRDGKKKEPDLKGTIKITLEVDGLGKIKGPRIVETTLPKAVAACMLKAVKDTPMPEASKCPNKTVTIPVTFPTPP